ncbi:hypothetical protein H2201_000955 [Coniosporium apollinis]|uniref:Uncharacterized protein n=1 Tax=Coniosporium apollinis TaxID=61459 RepID=A0ABQ9P3G4_9PEZI|nr:hypothetical protein H2201_000955 [Coniosporium apollinis]
MADLSSTLPPISPITAAPAPSAPTIDTTTPAINPTPVELDGTPTSPTAQRQLRHRDPTTLGTSTTTTFSPADGEVLEELDGADPGVREREKEVEREREARRRDPAVLVDIPQEPRAEELEAASASAGAGEGTGSGAGEMTGEGALLEDEAEDIDKEVALLEGALKKAKLYGPNEQQSLLDLVDSLANRRSLPVVATVAVE